MMTTSTILNKLKECTLLTSGAGVKGVGCHQFHENSLVNWHTIIGSEDPGCSSVIPRLGAPGLQCQENPRQILTDSCICSWVYVPLLVSYLGMRLLHSSPICKRPFT